MERKSRVLPLTRREQIRIKAYKRLAKHYERLAERAEGRAHYLREGYLKTGKVYRPDEVEPIMRCPQCGGRLIHTGCFLAQCEFVDCNYKFLFDEDMPALYPNYKMVNPILPTNYAEYKRTHIISLTREKDPEFFHLLDGAIHRK